MIQMCFSVTRSACFGKAGTFLCSLKWIRQKRWCKPIGFMYLLHLPSVWDQLHHLGGVQTWEKLKYRALWTSRCQATWDPLHSCAWVGSSCCCRAHSSNWCSAFRSCKGDGWSCTFNCGNRNLSRCWLGPWRCSYQAKLLRPEPLSSSGRSPSLGSCRRIPFSAFSCHPAPPH